jgi:cytochrome c2
MTTRRSRVWRNCRSITLALTWMCIGGGLATGITSAIAQTRAPASSNDEGKLAFAKCSACHALTPGRNGRGPTLYHLFGRKAGAVPGYNYSLAMQRTGLVWRDNTLTQFILDPQRVVPGTTMPLTTSANSQQMRALLDYLRVATH